MKITKKEFYERLASGLRNMDIKPDYLALIVYRFEDWEYDEPIFSGIPIIKTYVSINEGYSGYDYDIIPCFNPYINESVVLREIFNFQRGF